MSALFTFGPWVGGACCCLAFFVLLVVIASFLFRGKRAKPEDIDGLPPAPESGTQSRASLTMLEYEPTQRTPRPGTTPRPAEPLVVNTGPWPASEPDGEGQTTLLDRKAHPSLPPPPAPPPGTITLSPNSPPRSPRIIEPTRTSQSGSAPPPAPPPLPKPPGKP